MLPRIDGSQQGATIRTRPVLYDGTRSLFEQAGFDYDRPKGKNHCVMSKTVRHG